VETGADTYPLAAIGTLDPRNAASEVLAAFLRCAVFMRGGGTTGAPKPFSLLRVLPEWPDATSEIEYPSASIIDNAGIPYEEHALTPTILEGTFGSFAPNTVLWKTAEAVAVFQVDYWTTDRPTREAIAARLPSLFTPGEGRIGVVLAGEPRYFRRPVRATLLENERMDTENAVYERERRLRTLVRCEVDVVQLRQAVKMQPKMRLLDEEPPEDC
jgi:hypothetical protein